LYDYYYLQNYSIISSMMTLVGATPDTYWDAA
jgi:hypothetical protein